MDHPECYDHILAEIRRTGRWPEVVCVRGGKPKTKKTGGRVSAEDAAARAEAMKFADGHVPMALETRNPEVPPTGKNPGPEAPEYSDRQLDLANAFAGGCLLTGEEVITAQMVLEVQKPEGRKKRTRLDARARACKAGYQKAMKLAERENKRLERLERQAAAKAERAQARAQAKVDAKRDAIREAEGGHVELPAIVFRTGLVRHVTPQEAWQVCELYLDELCTDVENSGYPLGHKLYELRTVQLGGEEAAVVFDAADPSQMEIVSLALTMAKKLRSHSASVEAVAFAVGGLIGWHEMWAKLYDSVLDAKLVDPKMAGSDADALKQLSLELLRDYAVAPEAEKAKNELFKKMGCVVKPLITDPPERNGWFMVNKHAVVMVRYAGSDVLDLAAVLRVLPPIPVEQYVVEREREFEAECAIVAYAGFGLDYEHICKKLDETLTGLADSKENVRILSDGLITNPKSPEVLKALPQIIPGLVLPINRKSKKPTADKEALEALCRDYPESENPLAYHLFKQIKEYRHHDTTRSLLLEPLKALCEHGDSRMRPTVYTIEASTGRSSCRRPNGQQFSRQGGIRACVKADPGYRGITADFEGCEIRVAAALSGDRGLYEAEISTFCYYCEADPCCCGKEHLGLHWRTAHGAQGQGATKEHRYQAKRGTFTRLFGGGVDTAAAQVGCSVAEMGAVFESFNRNAPEFTAWDNWMRECYKQGSFVWRDYTTGENHAVPIEGANRMIYRAYSGRNIYISNGQHAAGNGAIQGTARELLVDGTLNWKLTPWGHYPLLPIHDQLLTFVPEAEAQQALAAMAAAMYTEVLSSPGFQVVIGADMDEPFVNWPDSS